MNVIVLSLLLIQAWNNFSIYPNQSQNFDPVALLGIADTLPNDEEIIEMPTEIQESLNMVFNFFFFICLIESNNIVIAFQVIENGVEGIREEPDWIREPDVITMRLSVLEILVNHGFYWSGRNTMPSPDLIIKALIRILDVHQIGEFLH